MELHGMQLTLIPELAGTADVGMSRHSRLPSRVRLGALGNPAACTPRLAEWSADILNDSVRLRARADGLQHHKDKPRGAVEKVG